MTHSSSAVEDTDKAFALIRSFGRPKLQLLHLASSRQPVPTSLLTRQLAEAGLLERTFDRAADGRQEWRLTGPGRAAWERWQRETQAAIEESEKEEAET